MRLNALGIRGLISVALVACVVACAAAIKGDDANTGDGDDGDPTADGDIDSDGDADADGGPKDDAHWMTIRSRVKVDLYTTDEDGGRQFLAWEDAVGPAGEFPFGSIFVAAYIPVEDGSEQYIAQHTVTRPRTDGDYYRLLVDPEAASQVNIFATLDVRGDGIVGSGEPIGILPDLITVEAYVEHTDADLIVLVDWDRWGPGGWGWQDVGGYVPPRDTDGDGDIDEDDGGCDLVSVAGEVRINVPYDGGNGKVMLLDKNGGGPYQMDPFTPVPSGSGAMAEYNMGVCAWAGEMQIVAAYDSNGNGLIDPDDLWGSYASEPGVDGNPVNIEDYRQSDIHVEIPIGGGGPAVSVVPFVHLEGTAYPERSATFSGLEAEEAEGMALYVVALRYPPTPDMDVETFSEAYDFEVWDSPTLRDLGSVEWDLIVPANTIVYLLAFVDADGDGLVNEAREPLASGGAGGSAALSTGEEGHAGIGLGLSVVEE